MTKIGEGSIGKDVKKKGEAKINIMSRSKTEGVPSGGTVGKGGLQINGCSQPTLGFPGEPIGKGDFYQ